MPIPCGHRHIVEGAVVLVPVEREDFLVDVGTKRSIQPSLIEVGRIDTHARARAAIRAVGDVGVKPDFFEAASAIEKQEIRDCIVGDKQIHPAIVVDIGGHRSPCLAQVRRDARLLLTSVNVPSPLL